MPWTKSKNKNITYPYAVWLRKRLIMKKNWSTANVTRFLSSFRMKTTRPTFFSRDSLSSFPASVLLMRWSSSSNLWAVRLWMKSKKLLMSSLIETLSILRNLKIKNTYNPNGCVIVWITRCCCPWLITHLEKFCLPICLHLSIMKKKATFPNVKNKSISLKVLSRKMDLILKRRSKTRMTKMSLMLLRKKRKRKINKNNSKTNRPN